MKQARIGVIGVGWWGTIGHLEPLADDPMTELVAVWSRTEERARERAERYGVPRYYTDYRAMIDECDLDGVIVASTPNMHYEQAHYALAHGLHVLMEKPFVLRAAHANALQRMAQERDLLLSVCHPMLFYPPVAEARRQVREGALGRIMLVTALFSQRVYDLYRGQVRESAQARWTKGDVPMPHAASYSDPQVVGGGEGHTQASHIVGALLWVTGLQPAAVYARMNNLDVRVDVVDAMTVRFADGALATVAANGMVPTGVHSTHLQIQGDEGVLVLDTMRRAMTIQTAGDRRPRPIEAKMPEGFSPQAAVPRNYVRAILGEEALYVETEVAVNEARVLDAAYRSAESGCEVEIDRL
jgi:predicted dehydrogenase